MNKPKILLSISNGNLIVEAASTDVEVYVIDLYDLPIEAKEGENEEIFDQVNKDMRNPIETVRGDFSTYIKDFIENEKNI